MCAGTFDDVDDDIERKGFDEAAILKLTGNGWIHRVGLPRYDVAKLLEMFLSEYDQSDPLLIKIFGMPPYTFADSRMMSEAAPLREFGDLRVSGRQIARFISMLPLNMKEFISSRRRGRFCDQKGRYYKYESKYDTGPYDEKWTVLLKKGDATSLKEEKDFPSIGEMIELMEYHTFQTLSSPSSSSSSSSLHENEEEREEGVSKSKIKKIPRKQTPNISKNIQTYRVKDLGEFDTSKIASIIIILEKI